VKANEKLHRYFEGPTQILGTEVFLRKDGYRKHRNVLAPKYSHKHFVSACFKLRQSCEWAGI